MKRYLLFFGDQFYPGKAWDDFEGDFDYIELLYSKLNELIDERPEGGFWYQIVDSETKLVRREESFLYGEEIKSKRK